MPVTTSSVTAGRRCHLPLKGKAFGPPRAAAPTDNAPDLPPGGKVARPEAVTDEGTTYRAFPVNGIPQSPPCGGDSPLSQGGRARMVRPVSPSVICFANATSLVRGRLFRRFHPPYTPKTLPPVGRFYTFIGNRAVLRLFSREKAAGLFLFPIFLRILSESLTGRPFDTGGWGW